MFTGIVQAIAKVNEVKSTPFLTQFSLSLPENQANNLKIGASVAVNGVCLTVVSFNNNVIHFDVITETLERTTLKNLAPLQIVNVERSAKFGDEIGGHILSGHIFTTAEITQITPLGEDQKIVAFKASQNISKYLFPKGYIALNGVSLTLVETNADGRFTVHLIPETLRATTFGQSKVGDLANVEIDSQTQAIVHTVENFLKNK